MFKLTFKSIFFISFWLIFSHALSAQFEGISTPDLKASALNEYETGQYSSALQKYSELIKRYPKDGIFHYYSGLCSHFMNKGNEDAITKLKYSSAKPNVPSDVYYYLGEAYMGNYQFAEARRAYDQYSAAASRAEIKEKYPMHKAEMAVRAVNFTEHYNPVEIFASSLFSFEDSSYIRQVKDIGGTLGNKPVGLKTSASNEEKLSELCFIPRNISKGEYVYFSGYGKNAKRGTELYRAKFLGGEKWSNPEIIASLNTEYNEILPYFDPAGKDLYFASEGHTSMGGYDVFKAHLNPESNIWTEPVNLGFPVNSPSNEYVFIPGSDLGTVLLITDRQGLEKMLTIYILHIQEPKRSLAGADYQEIRKIGRFGGIESIPEIVDIAVKGLPIQDAGTPSVKTEQPKPQINRNFQSSTEYNALVKAALSFQYRSDSLEAIVRDARMKVKSMPDPNDRWTIQTKIISWEKQSAEYQIKADEQYAELKKLESAGNVSKKDSSSDKLKVFRFEQPVTESIKPVITAPDTSANRALASITGTVPVPKVAKAIQKPAESNNQFKILDETSYSKANPIPNDITIPAGCFYRIQLGAYNEVADYSIFKGIFPMTSESIPGKTIKRYFAGRFSNLESAKAAMNIIKGKGFKDAFTIAWYNGQKLPVEKVLQFEKRDGNSGNP